MRKTLFAAVASLSVLSGCAGTGGVGTAAVTITAVQQAAILACSFLPTAATVANIIAAGNPLLTTAEAVATAICAAVSPKSLRRRAGVPTVAGVVIHGRFVK